MKRVNQWKAGVLKRQTERNLARLEDVIVDRHEHRDFSDRGVGQNARIIDLPRWENPTVVHEAMKFFRHPL